MMPDQVAGTGIVSRLGPIAWLSSKDCMNVGCGSTGSPSDISPGTTGPGLSKQGSDDFGSIAAVDQAPTGAPRRRDQSAHKAAAVAIAIIGRPADKEAGTAPAAMPSTVPAMPAIVTAEGGGGGRRQRGRAQRGRGNRDEREFA